MTQTATVVETDTLNSSNKYTNSKENGVKVDLVISNKQADSANFAISSNLVSPSILNGQAENSHDNLIINNQHLKDQNQELKWRIIMLEQGLAHLGQALIIVSNRAEVLFASKAAELLLKKQQGLIMEGKHLNAELSPDNIRLQKAIGCAIDNNQSQDNTMSIYIHRDQQPRPYCLSFSRMPKQLDERRGGFNVMILVKDLSLNFEHWADRLAAMFGLSRREVECVILLTERRNTNEVSDVMNISPETVRQYIKNIFKKMNVQKQHELVSLALDYRRNR